jgi:hypothetical protein
MNVAINTNLTDVIRGAISQLGGDARLVKATATKALQVPWFMGSSSGKSIPRSFSKPHVESFTSGEKILLVRKGDEFYYYNDDTDQWYMLNTKELLKHFTIEDSIKVDVSKPYQEATKLTKDDLLKKAKDVAKALNSPEITVQAWSSGSDVEMAVSASGRRTDYKSLASKYKSKINGILLKIVEALSVLPVKVEPDYITDAEISRASTEYSEYETEVFKRVKLTIK